MSISVSKQITEQWLNTWHHVFQGANIAWFNDQRVISGNFFLGLQGQTTQIFTGLGIPKGAIIESATMDVVAFQNNLAAYTTQLGTPKRGFGLSTAPYNQASQGYRGWRPDQWTNGDFRFVFADLSTLNTSGAVNNVDWHFRLLDPAVAPPGEEFRERMAQKFTAPAGAANARTVIGVGIPMRRSATAPAGSVRLRIMETQATLGPNIPDEVTIATSDPVLMSSLSTSNAIVNFSFTGPDLVALDAGTEYAMVVDPDPFAGALFGPWIALRAQNAFLSAGLLMHFGTGTGLDYQNFPGTVDLNQASMLGQLAPTIPWNVPGFIAGTTYSTPDISALIQHQVNDEFYQSSRDLIITTGGNTGNINRVWRGPTFPGSFGPTLNVTYRKRRVMVY